MLGDVTPLACFGVCLLCFHLSELLLVLLIEPEELRWKSLLLSVPYVVAMASGIVEHLLGRQYYVPVIAGRVFMYTGLAVVMVGEAIRKLAWITAKSSFTHLIQVRRRPQHKLVTTGIYGFSRHPGYLGWFIWAIGTQVLLGNPLCCVGFAITAWKFFRRRIPFEEWHLFQLFGEDYARYRKRVPTRIPYIP